MGRHAKGAAELLIEYTTSSDFNERRFGQLVMMKGWKCPPEEAVRALELIDDLEDKRADPCAMSSPLLGRHPRLHLLDDPGGGPPDVSGWWHHALSRFL